MSFIVTTSVTLFVAILKATIRGIIEIANEDPEVRRRRRGHRIKRDIIVEGLTDAAIFWYPRIGRDAAEALDSALLSLLIGLADQQAIIAVAILIPPMQDFKAISAYHFNIIASLAWFASVTHAITLSTMTDWMAESMFLLCLRVIIFVAMLTMYLWSQVNARDYRRNDPLEVKGARAACPAYCSLGDEIDGFWIFIRVGTCFAGFLLVVCKWYSMSSKFKFILYIWLLMGVFISVMDFINLRQVWQYSALDASPEFMDEDSWGFGQIVPVILLILPFLAAVQSFVCTSLPSLPDSSKC